MEQFLIAAGSLIALVLIAFMDGSQNCGIEYADEPKHPKPDRVEMGYSKGIGRNTTTREPKPKRIIPASRTFGKNICVCHPPVEPPPTDVDPRI